MKSLINTIGLAPSELTEKESFAKIEGERERVAFGLAEFKKKREEKKKAKPKKVSKKTKARKDSAKTFVAKQDKLFAALAEMGISSQDLLDGKTIPQGGEK